MMAESFYIGWDVGGWNCDRNPNSRDAIVILDNALAFVGRPWRGNLRTPINEAEATVSGLAALFELCCAVPPTAAFRVTLGIDTPLGFSDEFLRLASTLEAVKSLEKSSTNPYLYRRTERYLLERDIIPLSAITHMIGNQATKGMHVLAKFAKTRGSCGVWTDGVCLTAIEAYPSACYPSARKEGSAMISELRGHFPALEHEDHEDALTCALIAYLFTTQQDTLVQPESNVPSNEGWIWLPRDAIHPKISRKNRLEKLPTGDRL